ncbi:MAG: hypothetical protein KDK90_28710 [Leptospiraceae bacterium]|nr:hypothetical protein [Leptospiraceae bacterium]
MEYKTKYSILVLPIMIIVSLIVYQYRIKIAKYEIDQIVFRSEEEILFVSSVLPVYCQFKKIEKDFKNPNSFRDFVIIVNYTTNKSLPKMHRTINNIKYHNAESENVKKYILVLYTTVNEKMKDFNEIITIVNKGPDDFWSLIKFGIKTVNFLMEIKKFNTSVEESKKQLDSSISNYLISLQTNIRQKTMIYEELLLWFAWRFVFTESEKRMLQYYARLSFINQIISHTSEDNKDCAATKLEDELHIEKFSPDRFSE